MTERDGSSLTFMYWNIYFVVLERHTMERGLSAQAVRNVDPYSVCQKAVQIVFDHLQAPFLFVIFRVRAALIWILLLLRQVRA